MFSNFSMMEMAVVVIVLILVVGPKDLPKMLRGIGKTLGSVKRMAGDFQRQFKDALDEAELDEIKDLAKGDIDPLKEAKEAMAGIERSVKDPMEADPQTEVKPPVKKLKAQTAKAAPKKAAPKKTAKAKTKSETADKPVAKTKAAPKKATAKTKTPAAKTKTPAAKPKSVAAKPKTKKAKST